MELAYRTFDKIRQVSQAEIIKNSSARVICCSRIKARTAPSRHRQRREEANNVSNAIRREIIALSEILISHLRILEAVKAGEITMERNKLRSAIINPEPTIYKAVADRIGLLPYPVVQFYMRMVEIQNAVQIAVVGPGDEIPGGEAETIAKSVIIACRLARAIISHASGQSVDEDISRITLVHIDEALERSKKSFAQKVCSSQAH